MQEIVLQKACTEPRKKQSGASLSAKSNTYITRRLFPPHLIKPPARCSRFHLFVVVVFLDISKISVGAASNHFISHFSPHPPTSSLYPMSSSTSQSTWEFRGSSPFLISTYPLCAAHPATKARSCSPGVYVISLFHVLLSLCECVMYCVLVIPFLKISLFSHDRSPLWCSAWQRPVLSQCLRY